MKNKLQRSLLIINIFILIFTLGSLHASYQKNKQSFKYYETLNEVSVYYKKQQYDQFPYLYKLDNSDALDIQSFYSKLSINYIIEISKNALSELSLSDFKDNQLNQGVKLIMQNSSLPSKEKYNMIFNFEKSSKDIELDKLKVEKIAANEKFLYKLLELYEFMLENFEGYEIKTDYDKNVRIYFYNNENVMTYNEFFFDIQILAREYKEANKNLEAYKSKKVLEFNI